MSLEVGNIVEGKVTGITHFGAFVELTEGKTGLVHISEVADAYVHDIKDFLKENDVIKVKIINMQEGKIGLSIRQVTGTAERGGPGGPGGPGGAPRSGPGGAPRGGPGGGPGGAPRGGPGGAPRGGFRGGRGGGGRGRPSFEDKLKGFLKDSDERQQSLKRSQDSKRGGRGTRRDF